MADNKDKNYNIFFTIPEFVFKRTDISSTAKMFYAHIISLSRRNGYCYASNSFFGAYHKKSKSSVKEYLKELKDKGLIDIEIKYKKATKEFKARHIKIANIPMMGYEEPLTNPSRKSGLYRAQVRPQNNIINNKEPFVELPENEQIDTPKKSCRAKDPTCEKVHKDIIEYLNDKCASKYRPNTPLTIKAINHWLKAGYTLPDFQVVIDNKFDDWFKSVTYRKFLRPSTLFGSKFEEYRNQIPEDVEPGCVREEYPMDDNWTW